MIRSQRTAASLLPLNYINFAYNLGHCFRIAITDPYYENQSIAELFDIAWPAIRQNRVGFLYDEDFEPFAFLICAYLETEICEAIGESGKLPKLHPSEWDAGTNFCLLSFAADRAKRRFVIKKLIASEIWSIGRVFVRLKNGIRCYLSFEASGWPTSRSINSGKFWEKLADNEIDVREIPADARRIIFSQAELENSDFFRPHPSRLLGREQLEDEQSVPHDFWLGIALWIARSSPEIAKQSIGKFIGMVNEQIRHGRHFFYFYGDGHPEALVVLGDVNAESVGGSAHPLDERGTLIKALIAPKGLNKALLSALRKDLSHLPQPVRYSRERKGEIVTRSLVVNRAVRLAALAKECE